MKYNKQPVGYSEQIVMLKARGLRIDDEEQALRQLQIISYFRLANYLRPMEQDKTTHRFKSGSTFDNALNLYRFDKELRALIFTAIQSIEIALRTKVIHHASMKYGSFWFMNDKICNDIKMFQENMNHIRKELQRSKEDFIQEHYARYDEPPYPPAWKTLEVTSFGTLSKLYCNLSDTAVKKLIARDFGLPQHVYLESWTKCIAVLRNCCAHHVRIWNRRFPLKPQLPRRLSGAWIGKAQTGQVKLYAQLCCLIYLQNVIHPGNTFQTTLLRLLEAYPNVDVRAMGFPEGWQEEAIWQNK